MLVKELLYDALLPGMRIFSLKEVLRGNIKPQREREPAPILEEELDVYADYIVFRHVFWEDGSGEAPQRKKWEGAFDEKKNSSIVSYRILFAPNIIERMPFKIKNENTISDRLS